MTGKSTGLSPVCILAGGVGSRLGEVVQSVPKPLVAVAGRPFLFHQLELLRSYGAQRVVLCVGYLGGTIRDAVGDGSAFGLEVGYSDDGGTPLGTAGAVRKALPQLGERFLVLYGDTYLRIDYVDVERAALASGLPALMTVLRNEGLWDTSNVEIDGDEVARYDKANPDPSMAYIDYGLSVLTAEVLVGVAPEVTDLSEVFAELARTRRLAAYEASRRFYEIGTPEALAETAAFLTARLPSSGEGLQGGQGSVAGR